MQGTFKGMKGIEDRLSGLKLALENNKAPNTLFDVEFSREQWKLLYDNHRCPHCGNKLTFPRGRPIAVCGGKRHGDRQPFVIRISVLLGTLKIK